MSDHRLSVVDGGADLIAVLEAAIDQVKAGTLVGVIVVGVTDGDGVNNGGCGWTGAVVDGTVYPWARLQAAVDTAHMELLRDGIAAWC